MVDYSKWMNIEISDDEDESDTDIDTPSLFQWRHQAIVERMEEHKKEVEAFETKKAEHEKKYQQAKQNLLEAEKAIKELEKEGNNIKQIAEELKKKEAKIPWTVDTISKPGFSRTVINIKSVRPKDINLTEEEKSRMKKFWKEHAKEILHYGGLRRYDESRAYLKSHDFLICKYTRYYLIYSCIGLEMKQKHEVMEDVAHQIICLHYILDLSEQFDCDPRACLDMFFTNILIAESEYMASFEKQHRLLVATIVKEAGKRLQQTVKVGRQEVFGSLPDKSKRCFESPNIALLQKTTGKMDEEDARYHRKRCIDSGLWAPHAKKAKEGTEAAPTGT